MNNVLGLIPARGGSKGIPGKNIISLAGKPLLTYTCEAALRSSMLSRIILSTDSQEIADVGTRCGVEVPFMRPAEYAGDNTPSIDVVMHALKWLVKNEQWVPEAVVLLQPTSPLRKTMHIEEALELFFSTKAETVVSVVKVPHRYSPYSIQTLVQGYLQDFWEEKLPFDRFRRQEQPELYARNGPAVLITRTDVLQQTGSFYGDRIIPYIMEEKDSLDIDEMYDLQLAELILTSGGKTG